MLFLHFAACEVNYVHPDWPIENIKVVFHSSAGNSSEWFAQVSWSPFNGKNKQFLDELFVISGIIKVEVSVISRSRKITLTETLIISDITKTGSNNCFIIHCFKANNDKRIITPNTVYFRHAMFLLRCP